MSDAIVAPTIKILSRDGSLIGEFPGATIREAVENATRQRANLDGAYLGGANLRGAYLGGANLRGAYLRGDVKLVGERPVFQVGPIGSRADYLIVFLTTAGVELRAGCWRGTLNEFRAQVVKTHGESTFAREYLAAADLVALHAELWTPVVAP